MEATTATAATPSASLWEDFIDIFYAPTSVFERRKDGRFLLALIVLTVVIVLLLVVDLRALAPMFDAEATRMIERMRAQNPQIPAEQLQAVRQWSGRGALIGGAIFFPMSLLVLGLTVWLVGKLFGATMSVKTALMVGTYAEMPRILEQLAWIGQGYLLDPAQLDSRYSVVLGLARFLDPNTASGAVMALAARVDLFALWVTVLIGLGLHVTGRISKGSAFAAAGLVWLVATVPQLLGGVMGG
ncbi:MAG TPA: YIP1 family protein [Longimicrobiales bacterium]